MAETLPEGTVTVLFTDVEGSTDLTTSRGDEGARDVLRAHEELVRQQVQEHGGREVKAVGDGFMVAFGSARKAVACAVGIQRALAEHRQAHGFAPQVRIGVHSSDATQVGRDFRGKGVHEAARIAALAEGGEIVASKQTAAGYPSVSDPRSVTLKGISEPMEVVSIVWR